MAGLNAESFHLLYASNRYGLSMKMRETIGFRIGGVLSIANLVGIKLNIGGSTIYLKLY